MLMIPSGKTGIELGEKDVEIEESKRFVMGGKKRGR